LGSVWQSDALRATWQNTPPKTHLQNPADIQNNGLALIAYPGLFSLIGGVIYVTATTAPQFFKL